MILSVIIIWGVDTTEQHMVLIALDKKSIEGSNAAASRTLSRNETDSTAVQIFALTSSRTAKFIAPCGTERMNCAPAPRVSNFKFLGLSIESVEVPVSPVELDVELARLACNIVFIVLAGCITVWAMEREIAPTNMFSQNNRDRCGAAATATDAPPLTMA